MGNEFDPNSDRDRLDSWKEIAAYLKRGVTTVQRWEREEGLPVHRLPHSRQGSVHAYRRELDEWWQKRSARLDAEEPEIATPAEGPATGVTGPRPRWRALAGLALGLALAAAAYLLWDGPRGTAAPERVMLAVLPFQNLGDSPDDEYLADGVTEELITALARRDPGRLGVIARTSVTPYKTQPKAIRDIARELGVHYVVEGSVRESAGRLRLTAQLIETVGQSHVWAQAYDREAPDLLSVEAEVAEAIGQKLSVHVLPGSAATGTPRHDAHVAYLKGLYFWNKRNEPGLRRALELFREAIELEPGYSQAYAGLASSHALLATSADVVSAGDARNRAEAAARRALELAPEAPEGHAALSVVLCRFDWSWPACERELRRALDLDPNYATGHHWLGEHLLQRGRLADGLTTLQRAHALDPLSATIHTHVGLAHMYAGRHAEALRFFDEALALDPRFLLAKRVKGLTLVRAGRPDEGLAALREARQLDPASAHAVADLGHALGLVGRAAEARAALADLEALAAQRRVSAYDFAVIHAGLGQKEQALEWLEKAMAERATGVRWLKVETIFDPLRSDPRFAALVRRVGLPD